MRDVLLLPPGHTTTAKQDIECQPSPHRPPSPDPTMLSNAERTVCSGTSLSVSKYNISICALPLDPKGPRIAEQTSTTLTGKNYLLVHPVPQIEA